MENINIDVIVENLGTLAAIEKLAHDLTEKGKEELKTRGKNISNETVVVKLGPSTSTIYNEKYKMACDKLKLKYPPQKITKENGTARLTTTTLADNNAMLLIEALLNPNTKDEAIDLLSQLLK